MVVSRKHKPLVCGARLRLQAPRVHCIRNEAADIGMHPPSLPEEDAAVGCNRCLALQEVLQRLLSRLAGMHALNRLPQLHLVAQQHQVACTGRHRHQIGKRHLTRLVNK